MTATVIAFDEAALSQWHQRLEAARDGAVTGILKFAAECYAFKQDCERKQGGSVYTEKMHEWYEIKQREASMWAIVGSHQSKLLVATNNLPPSLETLYLICDVPDNVIREKVTTHTTQREAKKLRAAHAPKAKSASAPKAKEPKPPRATWRWIAAVTAFAKLGNLQMGGTQKKALEKELNFNLDGDLDEEQARRVAAMAEALWGQPEEVPETSKQKEQRVINRKLAEMEKAFHEKVRESVLEKTAERLKMLDEMEAKARETEKQYRELANAAHLGAFTREEFQLIRSCLHPDREADPVRKAKAFDIFNRLEFLVRKK